MPVQPDHGFSCGGYIGLDMGLGDRQGTIPWGRRCSRHRHNATSNRYANEPDNNAEVLGRSDKACLLQYCTCMHSKQCLLKRGEVAELLQQVVSLSPCTQGSHCSNEYAHVLSACMSHVLRNCIEGTSTAPRNQGFLLSKCCTLCRHGCCHACLQEVCESAIVGHVLSSSQPLEPMPAMCMHHGRLLAYRGGWLAVLLPILHPIGPQLRLHHIYV